MPQELNVKTALLSTGWAQDVSIQIDDLGNITSIKTDVADVNFGCLIPGIANLHSHAHQRAMAGLAERSGSGDDSFWTWRKTMYQFLDAMQPHHLHAIAAQLYVEMLKSGYTRVAEFQYLHHRSNGKHYDNIAEMSLQTLHAANKVGLGITSLPVHYQFGGFGQQVVSAQQARFFSEPQTFIELVEAIEVANANYSNSNVGVAAHSLRAVDKDSFAEVLTGLSNNNDRPIHIHIAEQIKEVEDCLHWSGARPVEYCLNNFAVDSNWCLIHATHMSEDETLALAASGAVAGLCPSTEANLGDGFFNATSYLNAGGRFGIGSDSHISVSPVEELRWLEYGQRLKHNSRNQLSGGADRSTARNLLELAAEGGAQACAHNAGTIEVGRRADFVVLDSNHPLLNHREGDELLDSWVFSGNENCVHDVYVGGERVIHQGQHAQQELVAAEFSSTMQELRSKA